MCNDIQNMISLTDSVFKNIFNVIYNKNMYYGYNNISINNNKKSLNDSFLQKKRNLQTDSLFNFSNKIYDENQSFISNTFELNKTDIQQKNYKQDNINEKLNENKINKFIIEHKPNDNIQFNNTINDSNIINIKFSLNKNLNKSKNNLNAFQKNNNIIESDIVNNNKYIKNIYETNNLNMTQYNNNHKIYKKKLFIITHENNYFPKIQNNNNEIKVFKNKKLVYVNQSLLNSPFKKLKKVKTIAFIKNTKRNSKYRGVSKNGNHWQVLFMHNKNKNYISSYTSEEVAARIYDILEIKKRGIKARTNFKYNNSQMEQIKEMDIDIKSKNIKEIICKLFEK